MTQSCLTRDQWQKEMENMNHPASKDCELTHREIEPRKFSFDISCKSQQGAATTGHWEMQVTDDEHSHGSGHMKSDAAGANGQSFAMDMTMDSHYLSGDCDDVKPESPKIIKQD